jgi:hypothetical protein
MNRARRRNARYEAAVRRQITIVDHWVASGRRDHMPAPVEDFLRPGDTVEMFAEDGR